ncbi:MAG TPA: hypothetical protein VK993_13455 [Chthoniobacterales bacterium]|nr:hypothetical protein [Chthoniobacterales bacterium]
MPIVLSFLGAVALAEGAESNSSENSRLRRWTNLPHEHREVPLFSIYGPFEAPPGAASLAKARSALDVFDFEEVALGEDNKSISLRLHGMARRTLTQLAHKHTGKYFVAAAPSDDIYSGKSAVAVTRMTSSFADGQITFPHPQCAEIARALRRRFRIAEFRLQSR